MSVETATYIASLNAANPPGGDPRSEGDNHIRLIKNVLQSTFPHMGASPNTVQFGAPTINAAEDNHAIFFIPAASSGSTTLPALIDVAPGFTLHFLCDEGATLAISPASGEAFFGLTSPLMLEEFDGASFICATDSWVVITHWHGVRSINGQKGDVMLESAMTNTDVTTALGYTPTDDAEFTGSNQSIGTNGYQKLPGGLILQWGYVSAVPNGSYQTFTYPIAFPNAVLNAQATAIGTTYGDGNNEFWGVDSVTNSSLRVYNFYDSEPPGYVFVIGH